MNLVLLLNYVTISVEEQMYILHKQATKVYDSHYLKENQYRRLKCYRKKEIT